MTRQIIVLAFVACLCISLTNAQTSCPVALQNIGTTFGKVVTQFADLQRVFPELCVDTFNCVAENGSQPANILTCLTSVVPSETAKIQASIQGLQASVQALAQDFQQLVQQCLSGLAAGGITG